MSPNREVFLVDIHMLKSKAFDTSAEVGETLRSILEGDSIIKVFYDLRADNDALLDEYKMKLAGIVDLQLMGNEGLKRPLRAQQRLCQRPGQNHPSTR